MKSIVLLAHGSRDPQWVEPFEAVRAAVERRLPESAVTLAYLDHCPPDFMTAVDQLVARGADAIRVVPLFLGAGGHVRVDVPQIVDRVTARHPAVRFNLKAFVGDAQEVLDAIADYAVSDSAAPS
ncbi:MAG TPA: CbiX/SirB N-terminal domain-containing protein [Burkholderiaceae bacterium]|nr:CbiX/SirB N-terminal domain-containing protein [Burkholderiaceae bacterium]